MLLNKARLSSLPWKPGWQKCLIWTSIATKNRYCVTLEQKVIDIYGTLTYDFPCLWFYNEWGNTSCSVITIIFRPFFWYLVDEAACLYQWLTSCYSCIYVRICSLPSSRLSTVHITMLVAIKLGHFVVLRVFSTEYLMVQIKKCNNSFSFLVMIHPWNPVWPSYLAELTRVFSKHLFADAVGWTVFEIPEISLYDLSFDLKALVGQWLTGSHTTL